MKNLDTQMEAITGKKPTKAEKQRQELIDQRKKIKETEKAEHSFAWDSLHALGGAVTKGTGVIIALLSTVVLLIITLFAQNVYLNEKIERQQLAFAEKYEALNKQYIDYLALYDFSGEMSTTTTIEATQDGQGINIVGGGDITNGAESANSKKDGSQSEPNS